MIVFDLLCGSGHRFEGWFASAGDFSAQNARGQVICPTCGLPRVERVPSATRFNSGTVEQPKPELPAGAEGKDPFAIAQMLYSRMLDEMLSKSEDVGTEFPAEARRIYYEESPARSIRGQATPQEHSELVEEGVPVLRLPIPAMGRAN
jgi:hypothetical protein